MYPMNVDVVAKREEEFKRERHAPERGLGQSAVLTDGSKEAVPRPKDSALPFGLHLKDHLEWGTEEVLLLGLILWQVFCGEKDLLLILVLVFLLLFD